MLTRGTPIELLDLFSQLSLRNGIITAAAQADRSSQPVLGQIRCASGRRNARLAFIYPDQKSESPEFQMLLDGLAQQAGLAGSYGILAEVDELAPVFETLRRSGFAVYGWQRIYRLPYNEKAVPGDEHQWSFATEADEIPIRQLFQSLVPPLVQAADPLPPGRLYGLVYRENGQIQAYIESSFGPEGIYLRPLIHPNVSNVHNLLNSMEGHLLPLLGRKVYLAVRSHQAWLENPLTSMNALAAERQALLVRHLAAMQRKPVLNVARSMIDETGAEPTIPPVRSSQKL
jgi:hypothetical protein